MISLQNEEVRDLKKKLDDGVFFKVNNTLKKQQDHKQFVKFCWYGNNCIIFENTMKKFFLMVIEFVNTNDSINNFHKRLVLRCEVRSIYPTQWWYFFGAHLYFRRRCVVVVVVLAKKFYDIILWNGENFFLIFNRFCLCNKRLIWNCCFVPNQKK